MLSQFKFAKYLQTLLDSQDVISDVIFKVRNNDIPFVDTIANKVDITNDMQRTILPVLVEKLPNGGYEPYPTLLLWDCTFQITFMFPLSDLESIEELYTYLAKKINGVAKSNLNSSFNAVIMAMGQTSYSAMQSLDVGQFSQVNESVKAVFGKEIRMTREWCTMSFPISCSGSDSQYSVLYGNDGGYGFGFTYNGNKYDSALQIVDLSTNQSVDTFSQQRINSGLTKSLPTITANGVSVDFVVAYGADGNKAINILLEAYRLNKLSSLTNVYFTFVIHGKPLYTNSNLVISNMSLSVAYGSVLVCSLSLVEKDEVKSI